MKKTNIYLYSADNGYSYEDYDKLFDVIAADSAEEALEKGNALFKKKYDNYYYDNPQVELKFKNVILEDSILPGDSPSELKHWFDQWVDYAIILGYPEPRAPVEVLKMGGD
jgi:hypothetical protein